jgi:hypothetical protein
MIQLPPGLEGFAGFLEAQPETVRGIFYYCLCLAMVETGKMRLIKTQAGEMGQVCIFETSAGEQFAVPRPVLGEEQEAAVIQSLREILEDDGLL